MGAIAAPNRKFAMLSESGLLLAGGQSSRSIPTRITLPGIKIARSTPN